MRPRRLQRPDPSQETTRGAPRRPRYGGGYIRRQSATPEPNVAGGCCTHRMAADRRLRSYWRSGLLGPRKRKAPAEAEAKRLKLLVGRVGIEPTTNGLRVRCSTS